MTISYLGLALEIIYLLMLILTFLAIGKRLHTLRERQIKYTEVEALRISYKRLIKILFFLFILLAIGSTFIILIYT